MATDMERMIVASSRLLENNKSVFVGTGMPLLSAVLAQRTHAPGLLTIYEGGGVGGQPTGRLPIQVSESLTFQNGIIVGSMDYVMSLAQAGFVEYGFLGGAEIDPYGNLNTTVIGSWENPKVRLPGSGGGADIASFCWRTIILMKQDKRKFTPKLDFITSPGYFDGPGARESRGLPADTGPYRVVTQLGVYGFPKETRRLTLLHLYEGVKLEQVQENSGFAIDIDPNWSYLPEPTQEELKILYTLDPGGIVLG
ncbi:MULTISPECIES: CoA-transferase subunit beta [Aneurinibacillus]|uniref:3-oxoacid CoA-transferase n=1 Tax=Aneurinibacillus thermoaerophilus TaxID=143495 RepID=A0A1G7ZDC0_ANETH|nr:MULTISPECIES: CoA-transferase [Aneurinibacillus]AMA73061.1 3-oxoacid CoA-transferase [Aneurinibacillus sp. XH2]MED0676585.1 CoA-transferase [Aneurinibacillus thermoaerophilus]MED0680388.1 CoA-transferase [Aneurinibacillus thermoaerophilus]MED0735916.1 CoA-transferase [Aneurinibacillus thermoaerophilus]MED0757128.1 CoA-transferase [Aneurinibacillus thermoaerophilus]